MTETQLQIPEVLTAAVADDECYSREKLKRLAREAGIRVVAESGDVEDTVRAVEANQPQILLLDIHMPSGSGFDVLRKLQPVKPAVIFTTAYDEYAVEAFRAHAVDYLLKPFDAERFHEAIRHPRSQIVASHAARELEQAKVLPKRLRLKTPGRIILLDPDDIDWVEAAANYVRFHIGCDSHLTREPISRLSERLNPQQFARVHRSVIVNLGKIKEVQPCDSGEYIVVLQNGKQLPCGRSYRSAIHRLIRN